MGHPRLSVEKELGVNKVFIWVGTLIALGGFGYALYGLFFLPIESAFLGMLVFTGGVVLAVIPSLWEMRKVE